MHGKVAIIGSLLLGIPWAGCVLVERGMKRDSLPLKLATGWFYAEGGCSRLLDMSYQGAYAFSLTNETIAAIKSQGIAYFNDIDTPANAASRSYYHGEWKETPVPASFFSDGLPANLYCGQSGSWVWPRGIPEALKQPGGYYQSSGLRGIFVLPALGLVVASASDR